MTRAQRHRVAPWVHMLVLGGVISLAFVGVAAWRIETLVWLTLHPEVIGVLVAGVSGIVGATVRQLPHFRNGPTPRELDTARERLFGEVLAATDTLTVIQGELDYMYARVVKLRDSLPKG